MRDYMKSYYNEDEEIQHAMLLKEAHTGRVQNIIGELAAHLGLSEEDVVLAELMGLLHDVGRFRQFTVYRTFKDHLSEDHAMAGLKLMEEHRLLEGLLPWEQSLVRFAVEWHNKKAIGPAPDACHLGYAKMLRDADKLDIYHVLEPFLPSEDGSGVSPAFIEKFVEGVQCDYTMVGTEDDKKLVRLMWAYDIYFAWTLRRIEEHGYLEKLIHCLPKGEKVERGVARLREYVKNKLAEKDDAGFQSSHESETTGEI
ncbi:MAG: HD domain-containing protein [Schwartzia sp.]|nr:HD domain-containing protein [Schwartzia sp. (in: firmicutes)]